MSLLNKASLIQIPSGYKDGTLYSAKPTNGDGDFTFSRGSNLAATRVNSEGLIEKGRENLLLQSNSFDTTWTTANASVTGGQSGYDGTNNAWLLTKSGAGGRVQQSLTTSAVNTFSVYAKAGTKNWLATAHPTSGAYFNLSNGTTGSIIGSNVIESKIEDVGDGWYKCIVVHNSSATNMQIYVADSDGDVNQTSGSIYIQDAQLELGLVATDVIPTTTTTAQAGILEDMPRLDYSGGATCGHLLLEPQRTNLLEQAEYYNAYYAKDGVSVSDNALTSPEGVLNASKLVEDSANSKHRIGKATFPSGTERTLSVFAKAGERGYVCLFENNVVGSTLKGVIFDLSDGTLSINNDDSYYSNPTIEAVGSNGWYRCSVTWTTTSLSVPSIGISNDGLENSYQGDGSSGIYIYGAMFEEGSYPTSYIPTYGSSVTRSDDFFSKTGISSLIGQTEGTLFLDVDTTNFEGDQRFGISDGTSANRIVLRLSGSIIQLSVVIGSTTQASISGSGSSGNRYKIAGVYKENDFALYINGNLAATDTSGIVSGTFSRLATDRGFSGQNFYNPIKQAILFPTRLTNDELAELTTL